MKLNVFGRIIEVMREEGRWKVFCLGNEGKKREAHNIVIPSSLKEEDLTKYIADLCHEWATPANPQVKRLR